MANLKDKVGIVTGGGTGIGRATALAMARAAAVVVIGTGTSPKVKKSWPLSGRPGAEPCSRGRT